MKHLILLLGMLLLGNLAMAQQCVYVDSVYNTAKLKEMGNRDIRFGIRQIVEEELSEKFCLSDDGKDIDVEVFYRNRVGELIPFRLGSGGTATVKILFTRKGTEGEGKNFG